jgi:hypothetical protein
MTMVLMLVTIGAVGAAAILAVLLAQARGAERRRSEARVAALTLAAGVAPRNAEFRPEDAFVDEGPAAFDTPSPDGLFQEPAAASPWTARLAIGGAVGLAAIGLVVGASLASRSGTEPAAARPPAATGALALESLRHTLAKGNVTITGQVENDGAAPVAEVTATAYLFAADGTFLASGRSLLERTPLPPGAESRFVIDVPVSGAVARYRVSFRDAAGRVLSHLDRREDRAVARNE